jgi:hypothetical protein
MEKSRYDDQAIQEQDDGYFGKGEQSSTMTTSAGPSKSWLARLGETPSEGLPSNPSCAQQDSHPAIRTGRADIPPVRQGSIFGRMAYLLVLIASLWIIPASAVMIEFENCLSDATKNDLPTKLQWVPRYMDAVFNTSDPSHNLKVTVWGNVTGTFNSMIPLPSANDTQYWGSNQTEQGGKILDIPFPDSDSPKITTIFNKVNVLTYEPWSQNVAWCSQLKNGTCPLGPRFGVNE